GPEETSSDQA
ncbi:hypothetical protein A4X09_0g7806, partial [Tilletia walkeri]